MLTKLTKKKNGVMHLKTFIRKSLNIQYISLTVTRQIWYRNNSGRDITGRGNNSGRGDN